MLTCMTILVFQYLFLSTNALKSCYLPESINITQASCTNDKGVEILPIPADEPVPSQCEISVKCKEQYKLVVNEDEIEPISACLNGKWIPEITRKCQKKCEKLDSRNVDLKCRRGLADVNCWDDLIIGTRILHSCKEFYRAENPADTREIACQKNGEWDHSLVKCIPECGMPYNEDTLQELISGGKPEQFGDSPWHIGIYDVGKHFACICGGTIISARIVLSAAHCFQNYDLKGPPKDVSSFLIVVSKYTRNYFEQDNFERKDYKIKQIIFKEGYRGRATNFALDIAVVILKKRIQFSKTVLPICVDWLSSNRRLRKGTLGKVVGWGLTENETQSDALLTTDLQFYNYSSCVGMISAQYQDSVTHDKFCAIGVNGSNVQTGDSGGGFVIRDSQSSLFYLKGVVSAQLLGENPPTALFTDLAPYLSWMSDIKKKIEEDEDKELFTTSESCSYPMKTEENTYNVECNGKPMSVVNETAGSEVPNSCTVLIKCKQGYSLEAGADSSTSHCISGEWTPVISLCQKTCPKPSIENMQLTCYSRNRVVLNQCPYAFFSGARIELHCNKKYIPKTKVNSTVFTCNENGLWDSQLFTCIPDPSLKPPKVKKTSIQIVNEMCEKYAKARYVTKTIPSPVLGARSVTTKQLDCHKTEPLIVGGTEVQPKEYPHMALIGYGKKLENVDWKCAGTLISNQFVLGAAQCSIREKPSWIRLGDLDISTDKDEAKPQDFNISSIFVHPAYSPSKAYHDIALYKLSTPVTFSPFIRPICLFTSNATSETVPKAVITGWGQTASDEKISEHLLKATVYILDQEYCEKVYKSSRYFSDGFKSAFSICASDLKEGKDTCAGDAGGPLQIPLQNKTCMYTQIGVTSFGAIDCGDKKTPSVYTRISYYINWIQSIVWPEES